MYHVPPPKTRGPDIFFPHFFQVRPGLAFFSQPAYNRIVYDIREDGSWKITSILRKAIYAGEFRGGDELSLTDTAARLGVSRTPVREAFQELAGEGLITLRMNRGAVVNTIDRKFVREIFEMRLLLESEAAERAAERGMETADLLNHLEDMRGRLDGLEVREYEALNEETHRRIWQAADNRQLSRYLHELWNGPSVGKGEKAADHHYRQSTGEHIAILEAIRDQNPAAAREAMAKHIGRSMENMLTHWPET